MEIAETITTQDMEAELVLEHTRERRSPLPLAGVEKHTGVRV
jgi:hypothetical protein